MDKIVNEILSKFKSKDFVSKIVKVEGKYVVIINPGNKNVLEAFYIYNKGKFTPYSPNKEFGKFLEATKKPLYDRRKKNV